MNRHRYYGGLPDVKGNDLKQQIDARIIQETGYLEQCGNILDPNESWDRRGRENPRPVLETSRNNISLYWREGLDYEGINGCFPDKEQDLANLGKLHIQQGIEDKAQGFVDSVKMIVGGLLGRSITEKEDPSAFSPFRGKTVILECGDDITLTINVHK